MRRALILLYISIGCLLAIPTKNLFGQIPEGYTCKGVVKAKLDQNCTFLLDPYEILVGGPPIEGLKIFVFDNNPSNRGIVECPGFYNFSVTNAGNAILCYGFVEVVDSSGPRPIDSIQVQDTLTCNVINNILNNPMTMEPTINGVPNKYYLGEIKFEENCLDCACEMTRNFQDQVDFLSCDSLPYFAKITRRWTATDCNSLSTVVNQYFYLERPDFQDLIPIEDIQLSTCEPDTVISAIQYPFWIDTFGDTLYLNELDCNIDINIQDEKIDKCGSLGFQLRRVYRVLDWCTGNSTNIDTIMIDIGDLEQPLFRGEIISLESEDPTPTLSNIDQIDLLDLQASGKLVTISTGPMDCTAGISLTQNSLENQFEFQIEDCGQVGMDFQLFSFDQSNSSPWQSSVFIEGAQTNTLTGLSPGVYALQILAEDECKNRGSGMLLFEVLDHIAPIARCSNQLSVRLEEEFSTGILIAQLSANSLNDNSFDNCGISQLLVRRQVEDLSQCQEFSLLGTYDLNNDGQINELDYYDQNTNGIRDSFELGWSQEGGSWYSPWNTSIDFFCCDQNQEIEVQLLVMDSAYSSSSQLSINNQTICTTTIQVIRSEGPKLSPLTDQEIYCTDAIFSLLNAGTYSETEDAGLLDQIRNSLGESVSSEVFCQDLVLLETIIPELDDCGGGNILRIVHYEIPNQIGVPIRDSVVQIIRVKERFDYWIRFPEDQIANCSEDLPQAAIQYEQSTCDLLAISVEDEPFFATENDGAACYKVFRTFQVINWCEYDGIASPVVVSRDWDHWNGTDCSDQYNVNPLFPEGNDTPGDQPLYVIVKKNPGDGFVDTVYYDTDANPYNQSPDDPRTTQIESYWWKVISGHPKVDSSAYYENLLPCTLINPAGQSTNLPTSWGPPIVENGSGFTDNRLGSYGYWRYTQHILINDNIAPSIEIIGDPVFCINQGPDCVGVVDFQLALNDECVGAARLSVRVWIDFYRDGENLQDFSSALDSNLFRAELPLGEHLLVLIADDNCGNERTQELPFSVVDCQGPIPICLDGMEVELLPIENDSTAQVSVFAEDLVGQPVYDCNGQGPGVNDSGQKEIQVFSINLLGGPVLEDQASINLSCSELGQTNIVEVHAWDETGQHGMCESVITVVDGQGYCPDSGDGFIRGQIQNVTDNPLSEVEMRLSGGNDRMMNSLEDGSYYFENLTYGRDYLVQPRYNGDVLGGVSTFDILLIQQHIVGNLPINSPYLLIAADANNSGAVSTLDMITIRKLILNIDTTFPNNQSWRFIDADYVFPDPSNPWLEVFPESIRVEDLHSPLETANFVGVKVGDVSGNALTSSKVISPRNELKPWSLTFPDQKLQAGQTYQIPFYGNLAQLQGLQMKLKSNNKFIELLEVESNRITSNEYQVSPQRGQVAFSWLNESINNTSEIETLFTLRIKCLKSTSTTSIFDLKNRNLNAEVYRNFKAYPIVLSPKKKGRDLVIHQNFPNPFHSTTHVRFEVPEPGPVELEILDLSGKIIQKKIQNLDQGVHLFQVDSNELNGPGVYYYRVVFNGNSFTKRMINL